jgi:hypothetical protein
VAHEGVYLGIVAGWAACWFLAALLSRRATSPATTEPQGWGQ